MSPVVENYVRFCTPIDEEEICRSRSRSQSTDKKVSDYTEHSATRCEREREAEYLAALAAGEVDLFYGDMTVQASLAALNVSGFRERTASQIREGCVRLFRREVYQQTIHRPLHFSRLFAWWRPHRYKFGAANEEPCIFRQARVGNQ